MSDKDKLVSISRLAQMEARIPNVIFTCYVCGQEAMTRTGSLVTPPDPMSITRMDQLERVSTCSEGHCCKVEQMRQDAIAQVVMSPIRDRYLIRRAEEIEAERKKK
jgi:hypothetical protein